MRFVRHSPKDEEVVRLPERPIVPGEEGLQRFLDGLLAVERRVTKQGR